MFQRNPGNANLPIGAVRPKNTVQKNQAARVLGWHSREYLPHFESLATIQHVTFHLADSLSRSALQKLDAELKTLPAEKRDLERRLRIDAWIDAGHGSCLMRDPHIADMVEQSLLSFDGQRYRLLAWVVMPNHLHVLFEPINAWTVAKIVASWKKFTARKICDDLRSQARANREIGVPREKHNHKSGASIWHREYWDRYIRDKRHLGRAVEYIRLNPVKAGLVAKPDSYQWSSAHFLGTPIS